MNIASQLLGVLLMREYVNKNLIVQSLPDNVYPTFYLNPSEKYEGRKINPLSTEFMIYAQ